MDSAQFLDKFTQVFERIKSFWHIIEINIKNINPIRLGTVILFIIMGGFVARLFIYLIRHINQEKENMKTSFSKKIDDSLKKKNQLSKYEQTLSQNGIMYRFHDYNLKPADYYIAKGVIALVLGFLAYTISTNIWIAIGIIAGTLIFIDKVFVALSNNDYKEMTPDLYKTYIALKSQLKAGCYIGEALAYARDTVHNTRYKEALAELVKNFSDKNKTTEESVDIFKNRFNNIKINGLCRMFTSYFKFGVSTDLLNTLTDEIISSLEADAITEQDKADTRASLISVSFFGIIILMTFYVVARNANDILSFF